MVQLALAFVVATLVSVQASPLLEKRIAQTIDQSTKKWEAACDAATSTNPQCNVLAVAAFGTLLAAAGPCDQQNAADKLMDFSKQQNSQEMIALAQVFCQQPRNSPTSLSVPYCQQAPKNSELNGLFQCQFKGDNPTEFVGGLKVGAPGTIPFGMTSPLSPPGSCPANPGGPIADGTQLSDITTKPFASGSGNTPAGPASGSSAAAGPTSTSSTADSSSSTASSSDPDSCPAAPATQPSTPTVTTSPSEQTDDGAIHVPQMAPTTSISSTPTAVSSTDASKQSIVRAAALPAATSAPEGASPSSGFQLENGKAAQKLNAQFASLTTGSSCDAGEVACVNGEFAQCVNGNFVLTPCSSPLKCFALPLVNSAGTTVTCTTDADAQQRIANSGATGGTTGS